MNITQKIDKTKEILKDKKIAIAFSGGADSTLISFLASKVSDNPLAITINNNIMPKGFIENTKEICDSFNIKHIVKDIDFYKHDDILANEHNRCYLCRDLMYKEICKIANEEGYETIIDGTNISDLVTDRPGILINYKNNILSPFVKAKLDSKEIHEYLDKNNINYSRSTTCIATRLPFSDRITKDKLEKIDECERFIYDNIDCKINKVRDNDNIAMLETDNIKQFFDANKVKLIENKLKEIGFQKVLLNLSEITDDEEISLENYKNGSFSYQLPYKIDLKKSKNKNSKLKINANGKIEGNNFNSYDEAISEFMELLPYIIREL